MREAISLAAMIILPSVFFQLELAAHPQLPSASQSNMQTYWTDYMPLARSKPVNSVAQEDAIPMGTGQRKSMKMTVVSPSSTRPHPAGDNGDDRTVGDVGGVRIRPHGPLSSARAGGVLLAPPDDMA